MTWSNALDVSGAELVARDPADPTTWFDPVATYPDNFSLADGVLTVTGVSTYNSGSPNILEVGVRLPTGYQAGQLRISTQDPFAVNFTFASDDAQVFAVLLEDTGSGTDRYVGNITGLGSGRDLNIGDVATPVEVTNSAIRTNPIILLARITITPV